MTGITFTVTPKDEISRALKALAEQDGGMARAALKNIGELLVRRTRARFAEGIGPDGKAWKPLNPYYTGEKLPESLKSSTAYGVKRGPGILRESGQLMSSIVWQLDGDNLRIGTNKVYGAIHQFGGRIIPRNGRALVFWLGGGLVIARAVTIPARPYLGISTEDEAGILEVIADHAEEVWDQA